MVSISSTEPPPKVSSHSHSILRRQIKVRRKSQTDNIKRERRSNLRGTPEGQMVINYTGHVLMFRKGITSYKHGLGSCDATQLRGRAIEDWLVLSPISFY